ncbi:hypothetical protein ACA910_015767 [Epithemia clementina (nom. ined.)]
MASVSERGDGNGNDGDDVAVAVVDTDDLTQRVSWSSSSLSPHHHNHHHHHHVPQQQGQKPLRRRRGHTPSKSWFGGRQQRLGSSKKRGLGSSSSSTMFFFSNATASLTSASFEKLTIGVLLLVAWGWIMVTIGMVFYHGYAYPRSFVLAGNNHGNNKNKNKNKYKNNNYLPGMEWPSPNEEYDDHVDDDTTNNKMDDQQQQQRRNHDKDNNINYQNLGHGSSPLLIFTFRRADYLQTTLQYVLEYIPHHCESVGCPVIVSQDGHDDQVAQVIADFTTKFEAIGVPVLHWQHEQQPITLHGSLASITNARAYAALAQHYQWALDKVFYDDFLNEWGKNAISLTRPPQRVIVLEEDLQIAPDFFDYFAALSPLLDHDPSLLAISAYNDNGLQDKVQNVTRLVRSDFFPGLGWMMTRRLWTHQLSPRSLSPLEAGGGAAPADPQQQQQQQQQQQEQHSTWPLAFWDDWLREPMQRQGRHIIRPEVSRTLHFGSHGGTSNNQFGQSLQQIHLNTVPVSWKQQDLSYLQRDQFDSDYWHLIQSTTLVHSLEEVKQQLQQQNQNIGSSRQASMNLRNGNTNQNEKVPTGTDPASASVFRLEYHNQNPEFVRLARQLGLFTDEKAGVPRTAYKGVVETWYNHAMILLTPPMAQLEKEFFWKSSGSGGDGSSSSSAKP